MDDTAYNFVYDFLSAFTPFEFETNLEQLVRETRIIIANTYTASELYTFLMQSATPANRRRFRTTPELGEIFFKKVSIWRKQKSKEEQSQQQATRKILEER